MKKATLKQIRQFARKRTLFKQHLNTYMEEHFITPKVQNVESGRVIAAMTDDIQLIIQQTLQGYYVTLKINPQKSDDKVGYNIDIIAKRDTINPPLYILSSYMWPIETISSDGDIERYHRAMRVI